MGERSAGLARLGSAAAAGEVGGLRHRIQVPVGEATRRGDAGVDSESSHSAAPPQAATGSRQR